MSIVGVAGISCWVCLLCCVPIRCVSSQAQIRKEPGLQPTHGSTTTRCDALAVGIRVCDSTWRRAVLACVLFNIACGNLAPAPSSRQCLRMCMLMHQIKLVHTVV